MRGGFFIINNKYRIILLFILTVITCILKLNTNLIFLSVHNFLFNFIVFILAFFCYIIICYDKSTKASTKKLYFYALIFANIISIIFSIYRVL